MPKQWLINYTRNNYKVKKSGDKYALTLSGKFGVMTDFEYLSDGQIEAIYRYIDTVSKRLGIVEPTHMRTLP